MVDLRKIFNRQRRDEKSDTEQNGKSIALNRRKNKIAMIIAIVLILSFAGGMAIYRSIVKYTDFRTEKSLAIDDGVGSQYIPFGNFFIKYGLDGISYVDGEETIWSQAYEMSSPMVDVCESYAAVADKGTNTIYVFDESGSKGQVTTSYPIISIEVANQGVVAALLEENTANYIEVYDKEGDPLISHKTLLNGNGYPLSFSLSDDGTKMIVSYVCINSGTMESKILFYNFSDVGQNEVDRMVGGFNNYKSTIIPTVKFLSNNMAVAIGDNVLSIYKMNEKPSLEDEIEITQDIEKVFYNENYVGFVFKEDSGKNLFRIEVYNLKGEQVMNQKVDMEFDTIKFSGKNVMLYDDMSCKIISFKGRERFEYRFKEVIVDIMPTDKFREYLLISNNTVKKIKIE